jgi:hypothetical protein
VKNARYHIEKAEEALDNLYAEMEIDGHTVTKEDLDLALHLSGVHATLALAIVQSEAATETVDLVADGATVASYPEEVLQCFYPGERFETFRPTDGEEFGGRRTWEVNDSGIPFQTSV